MKIRRPLVFISGIFFVLILTFSIGIVSLANNFLIKESPYTYTFDREHIQSNGEKVEFFQSGDSDFIYYHDKYGNLLEKYKDNIYYAENIGGAPVASDILFSNRLTLGHPKMQVEDIDFAANPDLTISRDVSEDDVSPSPVLSNNSARLSITHIVIYISFKGETSQFGESKFNQLFLNSGSLKDYFRTISYEDINVESVLPRDDNSAVMIYRDSNPRSYYVSSLSRNNKEAVLLSNAVAAVSDMLDVSGIEIDTNLDNYVDAVTFMIAGKSSSDWGSLLWPHQWNLHDINKAYNSGGVEKAKISGKYVGNYAFQFFEDAYPGVIVHEFSHVLGAPDLYHYSNDHVPVGKWDIMQSQLNIPQYPLAYTREKYLASMPVGGIKELAYNGNFSLPAVAVAPKGETVAYRIRTENINEFIMLEYRYSQAVGSFDEGLPGSGLIIYRINTSAKEGNRNSKYQDIYNPDEVLVYRPEIHSEKAANNRYTNSRINVDQAFLSSNNINFSQVGLPITTTTAAYDQRTLYLTNGKNTGIEIKAISQTPDRINFSVKLAVSGDVPNDYFDDKISLSSAKSIFTLDVSGVEATLQVTNIERNKISGIELRALDELGNIVAKNSAGVDYLSSKFEQGVRVFQSVFGYNKNNANYEEDFVELFLEKKRPVSVQLVVYDTDGDEILLNTLPIDYTNISFENIIRDTDKIKARVFATARATFGINQNGTVNSSPNRLDGQWGVNGKDQIIAIAAGKTHTVSLDSRFNVQAYGSNLFQEISFGENIGPIIAVQAGANNTFLLTPKGNILAYGNLNGGLDGVRAFSDITKMSIYDNFLVAVKSNGEVVAAGTNPYIDIDRLSNLKNIADVSVGHTFVAFLTKDGKVIVEGSLDDKDKATELLEVKKISAGNQHLLVLTKDGNVYGCGDNSYSQIDTFALVDIIDIATADKHSVFLRVDGVVEFSGVGDDIYDVTEPISNLNLDKYINVSSIDVHISSTRIKVGGVEAIAIDIAPTDATYKRVMYYIEEPNIIMLEGNLIKGLAVGKTNITFFTKDGGYLKTIQIEVYEEIYVTRISFLDTSITILPNTHMTLTVNKYPFNYNIDGTMLFVSSNPSVVSVNSTTGEIVSRSYGKATITATFRHLKTVLSTTMEIVVASNVLSVELESYPKNNYEYGESLDLTQLYVLVTTNEGTTKKAVTMDMISGYDNHQLGEQNVTITYLDKVITFRVTVSNFISDIKIKTSPKSIYFLGEPLVVSGVLQLSYADGTVSTIQILPNMIQGYDPNILGKQDVYIAYGEFLIKHVMFVEDIIDSISFEPRITVYQYMQDMDVTEVITANYRSGNTAYLDFSLCTLVGYEKDKIGEQIVKVTFFDDKAQKEHIVTCRIEVELKDYSFVDKKEVYSYEVGAACAIDMSIYLSQIDKKIKFLDNANITYTISQGNIPFLFNKEGEGLAYVTVFVTEKYTDNEMLVEKKKEIGVIEIKVFGLMPIEKGELYYKNQKTEFLRIDYGTQLTIDSEDIILRITSNNVTKDVKPTAISINYKIIDAEQLVIFSYFDYSISVTTYIENKINGLTAVCEDELKYGKTLMIEVYWLKLDNTKEIAAEENYAVTYDNTHLGLTQVVVTAAINGKEFRYSFDINIVNYIKTIIVIENPKLNYKYQEQFDPTSKYWVTLADGSSQSVWYKIGEFGYSSENGNNNGIGSYYVTITHYSTLTEWKHLIVVSNYCVTLTIERCKSSYLLGDNLSVSLVATMANGDIIHLSENDITHNFNNQKLGNQSVTITYLGCSEIVSVTVAEVLLKLELRRGPTKTSYRFGEAIDYTGISIYATKIDGGLVSLTDDEVRQYASGYKSNVRGRQTITITYHLKTVIFSVSVAAIQPLITVDVDGVTVLNANKYISLKKATTYATFFSNLTLVDYLTIKDVTCSADSYMSNSHRIVLLNKDGDVVIEYDIYLYGDANFDGIFDKADIPHLYLLYLGKTQYNAILDYNLDGRITLSDIVGLTRKISETEPIPSVNSYFRMLIAPIKEDDILEAILLCLKK